MSKYTRRAILTSAGAFAGAYALPSFAQTKGPRVAVIGGGFAGGTAAREMARLIPLSSVTHITGNDFWSCPLSNLNFTNPEPFKSPFSEPLFPYSRMSEPSAKDLTWENINRDLNLSSIGFFASDVSYNSQKVTIGGFDKVDFDYLVLAPGISFKQGALDGLDEDASSVFLHAWKGRFQNQLLQDQLHNMPDGGTVIITTPPAPYRCPPGPYERASLIAHYLKIHKPRSKVLLLDSNQTFSKQALFEAAWERFYPGIIERRGPNDDGRIIGVNANAKSVITDFDEISGDVVNVIPPQRAGEIARIAGVTDASGWCPVDPVTFESTLRKNIFVIGDAAQVSPMLKSAFAAAQQARICALNLARRIEGLEPIAPIMSNTCYSFLTPERACSITGVYQADGDKLLPVSGAGGQSPIADEALELKEAGQAKAIIDSLLTGAFG